MKINIKGLGAIKETSIDLNKSLTVFCGQNNTGKTYVSFIIYALTSGRVYEPILLSEENIDILLEKKSLVYSLKKESVWQYREKIANSIESSLHSVFGISEDQARSFFPKFSIGFEMPKEEFYKKILDEDIKGTIKHENISVSFKKESKSWDLIISISDSEKISKDSVSFIKFSILSSLYPLLSFHPISKSVIFPVERNSIYTFSKELSIKRNMLIDQMQDLSTKKIDPFDFLFKRTTRYPSPIRDGLEIAEDMENSQKRNGEYRAFAEEIERDLLQGKVSVSKDGEVQFTSDKAKSKKLPIHLSASIVKTLSSLVFYLKHLAGKNDLIIIDEPELNLHPSNQVLLTRLFARLINKGFRILLSTHSDYIIRELNNLIMLSNSSAEIDRIKDEFNYLSDEFIKKEEVNTYYFNFKRKTIVSVDSLPVTDFGFDVPSIDNTIDNLNRTSEDLFYAIKYGEDE